MKQLNKNKIDASVRSSNKTFKILYAQVKKYLPRAYSPYSKIRVAAVVQMSDGKIYGGCNIENASFGGTICAERVAITKAISESNKKLKISAILVTTNQKDIWPPCGLCRQVIAEFCSKETVVYMTNKTGQCSVARFSELFPGAFNQSFFNL